ncbi:hypothetical protein BdWA1_000222 [Babesia duncani]|uniref:Uncharacterized protein n=1 Tax=Babesia duncani TaxID=323732 RepID=A0AAD9PLY7_9APIC|nr:hypothetical protein BdWA1_000222 [Babesia duncani]
MLQPVAQERLEQLAKGDKRLELQQSQEKVAQLQMEIQKARMDADAWQRESSRQDAAMAQQQAEVRRLRAELHDARCRAHQRCKIKNAPADGVHSCNAPADQVDALVRRGRPLRNAFEPTMFDCPSPESQARIDALESQITALLQEQDVLQSQLLRSKDRAPPLVRRLYHQRTQRLEEIRHKVRALFREIRLLSNHSNAT